MLEAAGGESNDASEGRGDHARFTSHSTVASKLAARFLDAGTSLRLSASHPPLADATVGA